MVNHFFFYEMYKKENDKANEHYEWYIYVCEFLPPSLYRLLLPFLFLQVPLFLVNASPCVEPNLLSRILDVTTSTATITSSNVLSNKLLISENEESFGFIEQIYVLL